MSKQAAIHRGTSATLLDSDGPFAWRLGRLRFAKRRYTYVTDHHWLLWRLWWLERRRVTSGGEAHSRRRDPLILVDPISVPYAAEASPPSAARRTAPRRENPGYEADSTRGPEPRR